MPRKNAPAIPQTKSRKGGRLPSRLLLCGTAAMILLAQATPSSGQSDQDTKGSTAMTMKDDLTHREKDIHWPQGFDPSKADLFSHNSLLIHASCEKIWSHIVDATTWPSWYPNSKNVQIMGGASKLASGTVFRWQTFGIDLESRVNEFVPYARIGWYGYAPGAEPTFYHTWYLKPQGEACIVITDEVGKGADASKLRQANEGLMHRGHDLWLATLRWVSENK
jgi:Polyketide cyclase / dehydrase and lipid transport